MKEEGTGSPLLLLICSQVDVLASAVSRRRGYGLAASQLQDAPACVFP